MKKRQRHGQASGTLEDNDVILAVKDEIVALIKEGYTPLQIANAMKTDTFSILPKSVTQLLNEAKGGGRN
jgi:cytochrome c-type biogenesis protein CcmE